MTANTGLGCLKGFKWNSTKQMCQSTCEAGTTLSDAENVGGKIGPHTYVSDVEACRKYCRALSGAKFIVYGLDNESCYCKTGDADRIQHHCCLICPL